MYFRWPINRSFGFTITDVVIGALGWLQGYPAECTYSIYNLHDHDGHRVKRHEEFKSDITGLP